MKAVLYEAFCEPPKLVTVPDPVPERHGVVLKVEATGVCRSDWHGWVGHDGDIELPHVPGHELAGTVAEIGSGVTRWKVGDRVTVPFVGGCGTCPECHAGHQQVCENQFQPGFTHWGSFAELVSIHKADLNLVALPEQVSFATAASFGCRFATSFRAVVDQGKVSDQMALDMVSGKANVVDMVTALSETEMAIESMVTLRDKVISAYEEIMRMPI